MIEFSGGSSPSIASDVTDLPLPDSPTSATVLLRGMSNEMPFTASNVVCAVEAERDAQIAHADERIAGELGVAHAALDRR